MIETIIVFALFGMCILFMLLVLFKLLRESVQSDGAIERPRRAHSTALERLMWSIAGSHSKRRLE